MNKNLNTFSDKSMTLPLDTGSSNTENDYKIIAFHGNEDKKGGKQE